MTSLHPQKKRARIDLHQEIDPLPETPSKIAKFAEQAAAYNELVAQHARDDESWFFQVLGNNDLLRYICCFQGGRKFHDITSGDWAAEHGHLSLILEKERLGQFLSFSTAAMDRAAGNGYLHLVQWLHQHRQEGCTKAAMSRAAIHRHLPVVEWLHANRNEGCNELLMDEVAYIGEIYILQWLHDHELELTPTDFEPNIDEYDTPESYLSSRTSMDTAAQCGKLEAVKWLTLVRHARGSHIAVRKAGRNGHVDVLAWLFSNNLHEEYYEEQSASNKKDLEAAAAKHGHRHLLEWLKKEGMPYANEYSINRAYLYGHGELALWLIKEAWYQAEDKWNPVDWDEVMTETAVHGDQKALEWLYEQRGLKKFCATESFGPILDCCAIAGLNVTLEWLDFYAVPKDPQDQFCTVMAMDRASGSGRLDIVEFLHHNRTEGCTTEAIDKAAEFGHLDVVKFLAENRQEGCTQNALQMAERNGHTDVVEYLRNHHVLNV